MLKQEIPFVPYGGHGPAAFRRLCVETDGMSSLKNWVKPAAFRRLCVETVTRPSTVNFSRPAAFRRLCVETCPTARRFVTSAQPPSGGCVLKRRLPRCPCWLRAQPPSGGCVLKQRRCFAPTAIRFSQPPSGGCVLKQDTEAKHSYHL